MYGLPVIERWSSVEVPLYFYHYREKVDKRRLSVFNTEIERECQRTQPFEKNKIDNPTLFFFFFQLLTSTSQQKVIVTSRTTP